MENTFLDMVVEVLRVYMVEISPEKRVEIKNAIFGDYCSFCGAYEGEWPCQCENDE